jgi:YVTN family beta-propeller protein
VARAVLVSFVLACVLAPSALARDAYVTNSNGGSVSVIDTGTNTAAASTIPVGAFPAGLAITPDGSRAYVPNRFAGPPGTLSVIDTSTNTVVGTPIVVGNGPSAIAITPNGQFAYVANRTSNDVSVIDTATNAVVGSPIPLGASANPKGIAITPDGQHAYVANGGLNTVSVISTASNSVVGLPIPAGGVNPFSLAITPDGATVYVVNQNSGSVTPISTATNTAGSPIPVTSAPINLAISRNGNFAYIVSQNTPFSAVSIIDTATNTVVGSPITTGAQSLGMAFTPSGKTGYVSNGDDDNVSVIDTNTNTTTGSPIGVGNGPLGVAVTPDQGPTAAFTAGKSAPGKPLAFDATASTEGGDSVGQYNWNFGDGTKLDDGGPTPSHTFAKAGTYQVTVTEFSGAGCGPNLVFTGQTAYCEGNPASKLTKPVSVPKNSFSFGKVKLNKKKGTAILPVKVPGPGSLKLKGSKVKSQRPARGAGDGLAKTVKAAGTVKLKIVPKGKAKKKLNKAGKAKVKVKVTYTPTGGIANAKSKKIKLVKRR